MKNPEFVKSGVVNIKYGYNVKIIEPVNLYECELQDDVFIGPFVEIQSDVVIGKNSKIQSHSFICSMVTIGCYCFVGHGVVFVNDTFVTGGPARGNKELWKETIIGNYVSIGSNSTILPVNICDHVVIGAGSVVTKDLSKPGVYAGNPAKFMRDV